MGWKWHRRRKYPFHSWVIETSSSFALQARHHVTSPSQPDLFAPDLHRRVAGLAAPLRFVRGKGGIVSHNFAQARSSPLPEEAIVGRSAQQFGNILTPPRTRNGLNSMS